jgi:DNA repair exonuclease SbcCD ATPase subunit
VLGEFINQIIGNVNFFISKVWTYPLELVPIEDLEEEFSFDFTVSVDGTTVSDLAYCSEGQKTIIDLALTLSLMTLKGYRSYPLFLDEIGKDFDETHKLKLLELFDFLLEKNLISQLFLVNHDFFMYDGLKNKEVICLHSDNIINQ